MSWIQVLDMPMQLLIVRGTSTVATLNAYAGLVRTVGEEPAL